MMIYKVWPLIWYNIHQNLSLGITTIFFFQINIVIYVPIIEVTKQSSLITN